jgi:hypothetical protein
MGSPLARFAVKICKGVTLVSAAVNRKKKEGDARGAEKDCPPGLFFLTSTSSEYMHDAQR